MRSSFPPYGRQTWGAGTESKRGIRAVPWHFACGLRYLPFSRAGAEVLFQVFADRYERRSLLVTSNVAMLSNGGRK